MSGILDIDLKPYGIAAVLSQLRLRVPPNQRPYAWRDEHVKQLFDDWADAFQSKSKTKHYFMGTIVLNRTADSEVVEVSDGQQRLATAAIFIAAIRDVLEKGGKGEKTTAEKYTRNYLIEYEELEGDWLPRLRLNTQDHAYFRGAILVPPSMREKEAELATRSSNGRLARAYELAKERVETLMGAVSKEYRMRHLFEWLDFLVKNVVVIVIIVPEDVDAFTMFETLNDRGLRTSQVDNIKNRIFREAAGRLDEVEDMWLSMMAQIESFGNDETVISYIRHYWISENGPTREQDLARKFRESLQGQAQVATFVQKLDAYAADYEALFFAPLEHKRLNSIGLNGRGYVAAITRVLGIEQIRPLMMAVLRAFTPEEAVKAFKLMLSWSVRFLIVGTGGGGYLDRNYGLAAAKVASGQIAKARDLRTEFSASVPNDTEFESAFKAHSISDSEIARYVCRSLEAFKREEKNPAIIFFENPNTFNLEHVLPRKPDSSWDIPHDVARAYYKRIGNLALLDPQVNADIGNSSFTEKKVAYRKSPFLITKELGALKDWTPARIEARQATLASHASSVWPLTWT